MAKILYCFKSLQPVEVQDSRAIAKLHPDYDTQENREEMLNTPIKQLLARQAEGLQKALSESDDATKEDIAKILATLSDLQTQITNIPAPTETTIIKEVESSTPAPAPTQENTLQSGEVNEYGEII